MKKAGLSEREYERLKEKYGKNFADHLKEMGERIDEIGDRLRKGDSNE